MAESKASAALRRDSASSETRGRKADGQLKAHVKADGTKTWSMRIRWDGGRHQVRLGNELEGWNERLATLKLEQALAEINAGIWQAPVADIDEDEHDPTLHEFATVWFDRHRIDLDESTQEDYLRLLSYYILPEFKDHRLTEITYEAVLRWRDRLRKEAEHLKLAADNGVVLLDRQGRQRRPFGAARINDALRLLGQILHRAVDSEHYLLDRNPIRGRSGVRLRRQGKPPREHLEADEVRSLIHAADLLDQGAKPETLRRAAQIKARRRAGTSWDDIAAEFRIPQATAIYQSRACAHSHASRRRRAVIVVLAFSGVRASELVDLTWERFDHTHGRIVLNDAKTPAGVREIHLSPFVRHELELYRQSISEHEPNAPVFPARTGNAMDRHNLGRRLNTIADAAATLRAIERQAPLPARITPHTFRRTFITLSFQAGRDLVFVQTQAGHADWKTTLNIYTQQSGRSIDPEIKDLLDTFLGDEPPLPTNRLHTRRSVL